MILEQGSARGAGGPALAGRRGLLEALERVGEMPLPPYIHAAPRRPVALPDGVRGAARDRPPPPPRACTSRPSCGTRCGRAARSSASSCGSASTPSGRSPADDARRPRHPQRGLRREPGRPRPTGRRPGREQARRLRRNDRPTGRRDRGRPRRARRRAHSPFVTPGYRFRTVGALLTNFHLPRSTLLALVMAFCGVDETRRLYAEAIGQGYRFYSFGDASLLL